MADVESPVAVATGRELESVTSAGIAPVVLSARPVDVAVAEVDTSVAVSEASDAEALDKRLEKSDASDAETALLEAVAATLESCESREDARLDRAPAATTCVAVGPSEVL